MPLTLTTSEPFYTATTGSVGSGTPGSSGAGTSSADVPSRYDVALDGRPYMLDLQNPDFRIFFRHETVPLLRAQADQAASPSESSINPDDLWRRSQDTWHKGAGQAYLDRADSDPARFDTSKGVDVWTKWQLSLLSDTTQKLSSASTNLALAVAGTYVYLADNQTIRFTQDLGSWTAVTGTHASAVASLCTDGYTVYAAQGGGIYSTTRGAATAASFNALVATLVRYVKGRLMAAAGNAIYNVTASGAAPAALYTHPNTDFGWVDFAEGQSVIYAAGYSGDKSIIYRTAIKADGTALDIPVVAGELPDGEIVRSLQGYLGFLLIGSDKGVRFAVADSNGNLTVGSLIPTGSPVYCFEPQDRFCWYGLTNYDGTSTGLGRVDLTALTADLTPAYASDVMVTGQGAVQSAITFNSLRVLAVSGLGVYGETGVPVASGTIESGQITYRLPDDKVGMFVNVRSDGVGSHTLDVSADGGPYLTVGTHTTETTAFSLGEVRAGRFELRFTLTSAAVIRSWTFKSYPTAATVRIIYAPLLLHETLDLHNGSRVSCRPDVELATLFDLRAARKLVTYQEGATSYSVVVEDATWNPHHLTEKKDAFNGTCLVRLKCVQ